jgi:asparagine synthase (glutamine-hydrolysing)
MRVNQLHQIWRHLGPDWLAFRLAYAVRLRSGAMRRQMPASQWGDLPLADFVGDPSLDPSLDAAAVYCKYRREQPPPFFFSRDARSRVAGLFVDWDRGRFNAMNLADEIASGSLRYFQLSSMPTGFPPDWTQSPFSGERAPIDSHWSEIDDFGQVDIRVIWETSRFGFAFALTRAYWRTGDDRWAELFWRAVEDWRESNPPQIGPNWKCGQEVSLRLMAWCFAMYGLLDSSATTDQRIAGLCQMIAVSGARIEGNFDYALSQRNNHGITEAAGLFTIGLLFPELKDAARWRELGRQELERQGCELIYSDGSFSQHSLNYHRVMLQAYLWSMRLGEVHGEPFSAGLKERISAAGEFLYQVQDEITGEAPRYGQDDGSLILPLSNCPARDLRPVIQSVSYLCRRKRRYGAGPWDEDLLWMFGEGALAAPVETAARADFAAADGGSYTLRSKESFVFVRAASFRDRPSQADMLHADLWWRGLNIALDPGTYSYNDREPWDNPLARTAYHNTISVDDQDQMERVSRFLWLPWLHSRAGEITRSPRGNLCYWEGEHDGYGRLREPVVHRRAIAGIGSQRWLVVDRLESNAEHRYRLHWLLSDWEFNWDRERAEMELRTAAGPYWLRLSCSEANARNSVVRADSTTPRGWVASSYNRREPALSVALESTGATVMFFSVFGPDRCELEVADSVRLSGEGWTAVAELASGSNASLIRCLSLSGLVEERMEIS